MGIGILNNICLGKMLTFIHGSIGRSRTGFTQKTVQICFATVERLQ